MKKSILGALCLLATASLFANEELDVYTWIYRSAVSQAERYGILRNIADAKIDGAGELYAEALSDLLILYPTLKSNSEKESADNNARLLVGLIGESKYLASAGDVWKVVDTFSNPLVRADALIALGKMRSDDYLPFVVKTLYELNLKPTTDPGSGEKIAYGAIIALEKYRNVIGYSPVFFSSVGWYSKRVREQAARTLPFIVDDPSEPLSAIIRSEGYALKLIALQQENGSNASEAGKNSVALVALEEGHKAKTSDVKDGVTLSQLRKLSLTMLIKGGPSTPDAVPLIDKSYKDGLDDEEILLAVQALAANKSVEAAKILSTHLLQLNTRRRDGFSSEREDKQVRAIIGALGYIGSAVARPALQQVGFTDWTNAVKNLATDALKKIK